MTLRQFAARVRVVLTALPTVLAAFALAAPELAERASALLPGGERIASIILTLACVASFAVFAIRRLTPVPPDQRGILPPSS